MCRCKSLLFLWDKMGHENEILTIQKILRGIRQSLERDMPLFYHMIETLDQLVELV